MAQLVRAPAVNAEDLSSNPRTPTEKADTVDPACVASVENEGRRLLGRTSPSASLAKTASCKCSQKLCLKK